MKISLNSHLTVKTIDLLAVSHLPAFVIPDSNWKIDAIGKFEIGDQTITNIYTQCSEYYYLVQVWEKHNAIVEVLLLQNVLYLNPQSQEEWTEAREEAARSSIVLDEIVYNLKNTNLKGVFTNVNEKVTDSKGTRTVETEFQLFERNTDSNKVENLLVSFEIDTQCNSAGVAYYVGYKLHPSCLNVAG